MSDTLLDLHAHDDESPARQPSDVVDALFRAHGSRLVRLLTRPAGGRDEAGDLVQEAFLRLTQAARRQVLVNPEHYLRRITTNLLRNRARRVSGALERGHAALDPERHAANDGDPHAILEASQTLALYEAALMKLKPRTREIYLLHRLDGLSYAQIATELGVSVSAIEKQMMKAIAHIDRVIDPTTSRPQSRSADRA